MAWKWFGFKTTGETAKAAVLPTEQPSSILSNHGLWMVLKCVKSGVKADTLDAVNLLVIQGVHCSSIWIKIQVCLGSELYLKYELYLGPKWFLNQKMYFEKESNFESEMYFESEVYFGSQTHFVSLYQDFILNQNSVLNQLF